MSLATKLNIKQNVKTVRISALNGTKDADWMAWWYCGLYKNLKADSQPNVLVAFKKIQDGFLTDETLFQKVSLTDMGQVTVGSIWRNGVCQSEVDFVTEDFEDLNFDITGWQFASFDYSLINNIEQPYPVAIHEPAYKIRDKNWLIEFKLPSGGRLVVPCLEYFSRCYGRSQEVKRILAAFPWSGSENSCLAKLYAPLDEPEEPNKWKVKLRKRLRNGDVTLLAHAKYDSYTQQQAKRINAQIELSYDPNSKAPIFIKVAPWFRGPAEMRVKGIWFDNHRSFLGFRICGASDPDGILIERDRENTNKNVDESSESAGGEAWAGALTKDLVRPPDIVDLTNDNEPDHGGAGVEIQDEDFVVMGIPRAIVDKRGNKIADRSRRLRKGEDVSSHSAGEPQGSGKGIGYASIYAQPVIESQGTLIDMWNAMLHIRLENQNRIQSVEWFTYGAGYNTTNPPGLIALEPFEEDEMSELPTATRHWPFFDISVEPPSLRGVMVVRMMITGVSVYIIEIQRRPRNSKEGEESYRGFATVILNNEEFARWLKRFLSDVRFRRGIVQKLTTYVPGTAIAFVHKSTKSEEVPCKATLLRVLCDLGVLQ